MILTQIIINIIPILAFAITLILTRRLINSKLTNKKDRKRYKKYFNGRLGEFFFPLFLCSIILSFSIYPKPDQFEGFELVNYIIRIVLLLVQVGYSTYLFKSIRRNIINLKTGITDTILADIK